MGMAPPFDEQRRLESLLHELSALGGHNCLERVTIAIDLPEYTSGVRQQNLQSLDAVISRDGFRSLKAVAIFINIVESSNFSSKSLVTDREFCSTDELETYLGSLYGGYCNGLQSMVGLIFSCKVTIK